MQGCVLRAEGSHRVNRRQWQSRLPNPGEPSHSPQLFWAYESRTRDCQAPIPQSHSVSATGEPPAVIHPVACGLSTGCSQPNPKPDEPIPIGTRGFGHRPSGAWQQERRSTGLWLSGLGIPSSPPTRTSETPVTDERALRRSLGKPAYTRELTNLQEM